MKEKFLLLFMFIPLIILAQDNTKGLQGLKDSKGIEFYEWAGYNISIEKIKTPTIEKDISKLKKKLKIKDIQREYSTSKINRPNRIIEIESELERDGQKYPEIKQHSLFYILESEDGKSDLISIFKLGNREIDIENKIIDMYLTDKLSEYIIPLEIDSVNFIGRNIYLGNVCQWKSPNNLNCMGGQMSWSVFDSYEKAEEDNDIIVLRNHSPQHVILEDIDIPVLFEGNAVTARRIVYQPTYNAQSYPLIVYYIHTMVRGHYVSCVLSHYGYNRNDYELPDLLKEVMLLEEVPESAWNKYSFPEREELSTEQKEDIENLQRENKFKHYWLNIKSGIYIPFGGQRDFTGNSTYINLGIYFRGFSEVYPTYSEYNSTVFFDFGFVIPANKKHFNYYEEGEALDVKANVLANMNFGYLHKTRIKPQLYWENHIKIGIAGLTTNKKKPDKKDGNYNIGVFTMGLGSNIRYKRVGIFLDYQFAPYSKSKHLNAGGNSAIMTGLNITF